MKKIIAYSESNPSIGLGHLARTCQVLSCLNKKYFEIDFFCDYKETPDWISKINHNKIDIDNFFKIDMNNYDLLIFDNYKNRKRLKEIKIKKLMIDDFNFYQNNDLVDVILDWNLGSGKEHYSVKSLISGTKFFPIGENTFPEYINGSSWNKESKNILISFGGVSDINLLNIEEYIEIAQNFGKVFLMDPLSKLYKLEKKNVKLIQNKSLSEVLSKYEFLFSIIAGGTSKYILSAYGIPSLFVSRNELEEITIKKFLDKQLTFDKALLEDTYEENKFMSKLENISNNIQDLVNKDNAERLNRAIFEL